MFKLSLAFFTAAATCALTGMVWGVVMGARQSFTLAPAHAHLNLVGWASLGLMGTFYALSKRGGAAGWVNFVLSLGAVLVMIPSLALYLGGDHALFPGIIVGSVLAILGMASFLFNVLAAWREAPAANGATASAAARAA